MFFLPPPDPENPEGERRNLQRLMLDDFSQFTFDIGRTLHEQITREADADKARAAFGDRPEASAKIARLAIVFAQMGRCLRQTFYLQAKLADQNFWKVKNPPPLTSEPAPPATPKPAPVPRTRAEAEIFLRELQERSATPPSDIAPPVIPAKSSNIEVRDIKQDLARAMEQAKQAEHIADVVTRFQQSEKARREGRPSPVQCPSLEEIEACAKPP